MIGLQVGLSFTRESLRTIGRALPLALAVIVGLIVASAGLGAVLSAATGASALDGYLATTPGGLYAVLATATDSGADATFVLAVQVLRLFVMLLTAPLVARALRRSGVTVTAPAAPTLVGRDPSEEEAPCPTTQRPTTQTSTEDAVLLFVGGPLDGRVEIRAARHGDPLPTVTHVHLHDGPKVVHRYDLEPLIEGVGIYNLRPPVRRQVRDDSTTD